MPNVHTTTTWTSACVDKEGFAALVSIENFIEVAVAEEESSTQPAVWFVTCKLGKPL